MANVPTRGFLRDSSTDVLAVTTSTVGATWQRGFLRAPTGELVVTTSTVGATPQGGFLRAPTGELVVNNGGAGTQQRGFLRDTNGALCVATTGQLADTVGFARDVNGALVVSGLVAFVPTDLPSLVGWWKAETIAQVNGTAVASWAASGGTLGALAQAVGANQPIYNTGMVNGLPAVTFDGVNDFLTTAAAASPTAGVTVMAICRPTVDATFRYLAQHAAAATWISPFARWAIRWNGGTQQMEGWVDSASAPANIVTEATAATSGVWQVVEFVYDQTNLQLYRTETSVATKARTGLMTSSTQPVFVGTDTGGAEPFSGNIVELVVCSTGLNATDRANLGNYLRGRAAL